MTRGEVPEIPDHLQESVRSAGAYEQDTRRAFQIRDYARKRQIPETSMKSNATVRRFVTVLRDADAAKVRFGRSEAIGFMQDSDPVAYDRVRQVSRLYAAEVMILEEGFQAHLDGGVDLPVRPVDIDPIRKSSLTRILDRAAQPYGLAVNVPDDWYDRRDEEVFPGWVTPYRPRPGSVAGVWTGAPLTTGQREPWRRTDGADHLWYWPDWPNERHDREHLRALGEEASRQGIDPERPRTDAMLHTLLTGIVYGRQLVAETEDVRSLPPAPGMNPTAQERLERVTPLNRLAVEVLEDAVHPGTMTREHFAVGLAPVLRTYGLRFRSRQM